MKFNHLKYTIAALLVGFGASSTALATVTVTINNPSSKTVTLVSGTTGFPSFVEAKSEKTFVASALSSSSHVEATYSSGYVSGGCKFSAGHKENSIGPVYSSSASGYGALSDSECSVYVSEKWSKPYNYKVNFTIYL